MMKQTLSLAAIAAFGMSPTLVSADVVVLQGPAVTDDATVNAFFNGEAYQSKLPGNLELGGSSASNRAWAAVRFDLPALQPGESISDATMTFDYFGNYNTANTSVNVSLHRLLYSWTESEVTWDERSAGVRWEEGAAGNIGYQNDPAPPANYDAQSLGSITLAYNDYGLKTYQSAELTSVLNQMAQGTLANNGFVLTVTTTAGTNRFYLVSSDRTSDGVHPELELTIVPEPASFGLFALGGLVIAAHRRRA